MLCFSVCFAATHFIWSPPRGVVKDYTFELSKGLYLKNTPKFIRLAVKGNLSQEKTYQTLEKPARDLRLRLNPGKQQHLSEQGQTQDFRSPEPSPRIQSVRESTSEYRLVEAFRVPGRNRYQAPRYQNQSQRVH